MKIVFCFSPFFPVEIIVSLQNNFALVCRFPQLVPLDFSFLTLKKMTVLVDI